MHEGFEATSRRKLTSATLVGAFLVLEFDDGYGLRFMPSQVQAAEAGYRRWRDVGRRPRALRTRIVLRENDEG